MGQIWAIIRFPRRSAERGAQARRRGASYVRLRGAPKGAAIAADEDRCIWLHSVAYCVPSKSSVCANTFAHSGALLQGGTK